METAGIGLSDQPGSGLVDAFSSALAPRKGELLWDIGAGSGSIGIEWMLADPFGANLLAHPPRRMFNPAWAMVAASKGLLPILWDLFPGHPHLLAASRNAEDLKPYGRIVAKPLRGREGQNVEIREGERILASTGAPLWDAAHVTFGSFL